MQLTKDEKETIKILKNKFEVLKSIKKEGYSNDYIDGMLTIFYNHFALLGDYSEEFVKEKEVKK